MKRFKEYLTEAAYRLSISDWLKDIGKPELEEEAIHVTDLVNSIQNIIGDINISLSDSLDVKKSGLVTIQAKIPAPMDSLYKMVQNNKIGRVVGWQSKYRPAGKGWVDFTLGKLKVSFTEGLGSKSDSSGGKAPSGADWEDLITYGYNLECGIPDHDLSAKEKAINFGDLYIEKGREIAKTFYSKLGDNSGMTQFGAGKSSSNLSQNWKNWGATDGTPKTDMYTDDYNISLKKAGGSQLASGAKNETKAYFKAALEFLGDEDNQIINGVLKEVDNNFKKIATKYTATELADISKRGNIDLSTLELFDKTEQWHKEYNKILEEVFNEKVVNNIVVKEWVIFEAMSGYTKFGVGTGDGNSLCASSVCIEFKPTSGEITSFIPVTSDGKVSEGDPVLSSELKSIAPKAKFYVAWKSASGNPYSAFRISANKKSVNESVNTYRDIIRNEVRNDKVVNMLLTEDVEYLNEFAVIKKVFRRIKGMGKDAIKWVSNLMERIFTQFQRHLETLKRLGKSFFQELFQFLGIEIKSVSMSMPRELEGFV